MENKRHTGCKIPMYEVEFKDDEFEQNFIIWINHCVDHNEPVSMEFVRFSNPDFKHDIECKHPTTTNYRTFIDQIPEGIKPFSLKISLCNECHAPTDYQLIIHKGKMKNHLTVGQYNNMSPSERRKVKIPKEKALKTRSFA